MTYKEKNKLLKIGLIQTKVSEDMKANLENTAKLVQVAAEKGAKIVCLQELYRTRYFPQKEKQNFDKFVETIPGESTKVFCKIAKKYGIVIIVPLFEKNPNGKYYNSAVVINSDGKLLDTYHKIHVPQDPLFYEKNYFDAGDLGYKVYETDFAKVGVLICYDQWFPEAARINVLKGAEIIFYPTAIGWIKGHISADGNWLEAWKTIQRGHAIANGVHIAAVNRVGEEDELEFWGNSFVCDSFGEILKQANTKQDEVLIVEVNLKKNEKIREGWGFLKNRRAETYLPLVEKTTLQSSDNIKNQIKKTTPSQLGFIMPAEWEKHDAIWLSWPHDPVTFPNRVKKVEKTYVQIIKHIHESEEVNLFVKNEEMEKKVKLMLEEESVDLDRVHFFKFDYADVWFRDYGPIFITNSKNELAMVHWIFNSWGEKYQELLKDCQVPRIINQSMQIDCYEPGIVLEGGSIEVNGKGTLLTTEQCLLNRNRNPNLQKDDVEKYLKNFLGVNHILWLKQGIVGDDTDGHIDDIARFVNPTTVVCAYEENEDDENHAILKENYEMLKNMVDQDGNKLKIIKLPMPGFVGNKKGRLPASYTNFYIGNKKVLVPIFGHKNDKKALDILQTLFPEREIIGIHCKDLVYGLGTLHCISQQQPAVNQK
ncbi:MAG: peptidyl-arginine deiminase [Crenarchaeota archaeon]|nr:peptidyl-arginine deiminase [Thermoproteota archaeon]